ncbi:MAG: molybdenum cofactor guanylyltransferase [Candidatus Binataceae bacterium]
MARDFPESAIVLAGGPSKRMGRSKAALPFGASTLLGRIVDELSRGFREVVVVAAPVEVEQLPIEFHGVTVVRDKAVQRGPVAALARGLESIEGDTTFACSCDLPMLRVDVALALAGMLDDYDAVIPEVGMVLQPLHSVYRKECLDELRALEREGEARLVELIGRINARVVVEEELRELDRDLLSFFSIDTPADYGRALELSKDPFGGG